MRRNLRLTCAALALLALAVTAGPAAAASPLGDRRYRALDALATALLPFDRDTVSTSAIDGAQRACNRLDPDDALLGPIRRHCRATIAFVRKAEILSECGTPEGCAEASMAVRVSVSPVLDRARAANRAIERIVRSPPCERAIRTPASELRPLERLIPALRLLERAIEMRSQEDLEEANGRIKAFDRDVRAGPTAREYRARFRRACR